MAPARAGLSVTLSPVDIRVARARNVVRGGFSGERDTGRRLGSGSDLLWPDSEAGHEDPEPGKRGLGGQPVTQLGRVTRPCLQAPPVRRAVSIAAVRIGSRPAARCGLVCSFYTQLQPHDRFWGEVVFTWMRIYTGLFTLSTCGWWSVDTSLLA